MGPIKAQTVEPQVAGDCCSADGGLALGKTCRCRVQDDPLHGRPECADTNDGKPFVPVAASGMMKATSAARGVVWPVQFTGWSLAFWENIRRPGWLDQGHACR